MLQEAIQFAANAHAGQWRDGDHPVPYICHPIEVMLNLRHVGEVIDEAILVSAVLHDVLEECPQVSEDQIRESFSDRVASLVMAVTRREPTNEETAGLSDDERWQYRSELLLSEIAAMSNDAQMIKLADRLSNITEAKRTRKGKKLKRYVAQTKAMLEIIPRQRNPRLWDAIQRCLQP